MKPHPDLVIEDMLKDIMSSDAPVEAVGRETSAQEIAEATAAFKAELAKHMTKVRTLCIGCGEDTPLFQTLPCECGGFVCQACRKIEVEGECHHEPPSWVPSS